MPHARCAPINPVKTSPEPAVASSGPAFVLIAARPSGAAITAAGEKHPIACRQANGCELQREYFH
jgi:hypothetical protein